MFNLHCINADLRDEMLIENGLDSKLNSKDLRIKLLFQNPQAHCKRWPKSCQNCRMPPNLAQMFAFCLKVNINGNKCYYFETLLREYITTSTEFTPYLHPRKNVAPRLRGHHDFLGSNSSVAHEVRLAHLCAVGWAGTTTHATTCRTHAQLPGTMTR